MGGEGELNQRSQSERISIESRKALASYRANQSTSTSSERTKWSRSLHLRSVGTGIDKIQVSMVKQLPQFYRRVSSKNQPAACVPQLAKHITVLHEP
jgi:hypothetical protein